MKIDHRFNAPTFFSLLTSGIGFVALVITFAYATFQTKSEASQQANNIKDRQEEVDVNIHELRTEIQKLSYSLNEKLDRILILNKR